MSSHTSCSDCSIRSPRAVIVSGRALVVAYKLLLPLLGLLVLAGVATFLLL